jgi:helicase-like protein
MAAAMDVLDAIHRRGERALVFIEHLKLQYRFAELARLRFGLQEVPVVNGDTPIPKRQKTVDRFQRHLGRDEGFDLLVLGPRAAGTGLTLTAASHVIHLSRWWNPAVEEQCNDRAHRIGQARPVTVHLPLAIHPEYRSQSFDCLLERLMRRKRDLATSVLWPAGDTNADAIGLQADLTAQASVLSPTPEGVRDDLAKRGARKISANVYCLPPLGPDAPNVLVGIGVDEGEIRRALALMAGSTAWATAFVAGTPPSGISSLRMSDMSLWPEFVDCVGNGYTP